jgi:5-methylcytosine-specific restriction endonuclease McrA
MDSSNIWEAPLPYQVLVLNSTYEPVNVCSARRAVVLLLKGKAEVVNAGAWTLHSERISLVVPAVIKLAYYVHVPRTDRRRLSRRAILARDGFCCQYCGSYKHLTLDHVIPRSRGGATSWDNVVTSCAPCNVRKGASLPGEVGMMPSRRPRPPLPSDFVLASQRHVPDAWLPYLETATA